MWDPALPGLSRAFLNKNSLAYIKGFPVQAQVKDYLHGPILNNQNRTKIVIQIAATSKVNFNILCNPHWLTIVRLFRSNVSHVSLYLFD
jgi:hypothetical protein